MKYYSAFKTDLGLYLLMQQEIHGTMWDGNKSRYDPFIENYYFLSTYVQKNL